MSDAAQDVRVSTPGKLILSGEHAVVYGAPALVTAIGLRLRTRLERTAGTAVELRMEAIGHESVTTLSEIREYAQAQREAWQRFAGDPSPEGFAELDDGDPSRLVKVALGEALRALDADAVPEGLRLTVESDLPVGSGFGSSAAAAVGIVSAVFALAGVATRWSEIGPVVAEVERRQHGSPSGVDAATVFHGGVLRAVPADDGLRFEPLAARADLLHAVRVLDSGRPAESTGEVVAAVARRRQEAPAAFAGAFESMRRATVLLQTALTAPDTVADDLLEPLRSYQRSLEAIGVVPPAVAELVRRIEAAGGAAKLSGAGALTGSGAGCVLAVLPEEVPADLLRGVESIPASLAAEGLRVESVR
jgi:mevalonate kinase